MRARFVPKPHPMTLELAILEHLKGNAIRLPPYPATALKLSRVLSDGSHHRAQVLDVVKADAPLVAAVLRVANSARWAGLPEVTTLTGAISRIGEAELSRLALASGLAGALNATGPLATIRRRIWHDSISTAVCAGVIAPRLGLDSEELFVAGLLHDIGRLVALNTLEDLLRQRPGEPARTGAGWWNLVERYHLELGLRLAASWQLPPLLVDCISQHHQVSPAGRFSQQVRAIAVVDQLIDVLNSGVPLTGPVLASMLVIPDPADHAGLAAELARAPASIASFEDPVTCERVSKVTREPGPAAAVPPAVPLVFHLGNGAEADCLSASATEVAFRSPAPFPENFLQNVEVALPDQRFPLWLRISACAPAPASSPGAWDVVGQPFALSGPALTRWLSVLRDDAGHNTTFLTG
jgi:putative nucleotidyltransferase with HDIG domain